MTERQSAEQARFEVRITTYAGTIQDARTKMVLLLEAELRKLKGSRRGRDRGDRRGVRS